jgi:hypothetical protein
MPSVPQAKRTKSTTEPRVQPRSEHSVFRDEYESVWRQRAPLPCDFVQTSVEPCSPSTPSQSPLSAWLASKMRKLASSLHPRPQYTGRDIRFSLAEIRQEHTTEHTRCNSSCSPPFLESPRLLPRSTHHGVLAAVSLLLGVILVAMVAIIYGQ